MLTTLARTMLGAVVVLAGQTEGGAQAGLDGDDGRDEDCPRHDGRQFGRRRRRDVGGMRSRRGAGYGAVGDWRGDC